MGSFERVMVTILFMFVITGFIVVSYTGFYGLQTVDSIFNGENPKYSNVSSSFVEDKTEEAFYEAYSEYRRSHNLGNIDKKYKAEIIAEDKSIDMARDDYFSHTSPTGVTFENRIDKYDNDCITMSENIAYNHYKKPVDLDYGGTETFNTPQELANAILEQYEHSRGHRLNMENERWDSHGIDVVLTEDNEVYHTHIFCDS